MSGIILPQLVPHTPVPMRRFRLRWRFDFIDKKSKCGVWDLASNLFVDSAVAVNKSGLLWASIEAESIDPHNYKLETLVQVPGQDFASFQGEVFSRVGAFGVGEAQVRAHVCGISLLTNDECITANVDGSVARRALTAKEKEFKIYEHSV